MIERWRLESSDNELKFFFDDTLAIHLFKFNETWSVNFLGQQKTYQCRDLGTALETAKIAATECGWINL
jgi:hypothetical protein